MTKIVWLFVNISPAHPEAGLGEVGKEAWILHFCDLFQGLYKYSNIDDVVTSKENMENRPSILLCIKWTLSTTTEHNKMHAKQSDKAREIYWRSLSSLNKFHVKHYYHYV